MDYPLEKNGFQRLRLCSNKRMSIATCEIVFSDLSRMINTDVTLADGVKLTIKLGRSIEDYDVYNYRVYNFKRDPVNSTNQYTVFGYLDAPGWFFGAWRKPIEDTSANVIAALASASGLEPECDATDDLMLWLPGNERTCMFARSVAARGFLDTSSGMVMGMTLTGVLRYKNLTTLPDSGPIFTHGDVPETCNVIDHKYLTGSGYGNAIGGYNHLIRPQLIREEREPTDGLDIKRKTQMFQQNVEIKGMMGRGRMDFGDIDGGNTHDFWEESRYQNIRTAMLYSTGVELLTNQRTPIDLDLFSALMYEPYDPPAGGRVEIVNEVFRSVYYVTAKTIEVRMGDYFEKFQCCSTGVNKDPDQRGSQL